MTRTMRRVIAVLVVVIAGCTGGAAPEDLHWAEHGAAGHEEGHEQSPSLATALQATLTGYQLRTPLSGAAAITAHGQVLLVGGDPGRGAPSGTVVLLNPVSGRSTQLPALAAPVMDGAIAMVRGSPVLFGGWATRSVRTAQAIRVSTAPQPAKQPTAPAASPLPVPRSGLAAATSGRTTYLVGGLNGPGFVASVLATTGGSGYAIAARLPLAVGYPAVVATDGQLLVFGGLTPAGATTAIQRVDLRTGRAQIVGHLPRSLAGASAFVLGGQIYIAGGQSQPGGMARSRRTMPIASSTIFSYDPATGAVRAAGQLPIPTAHAACAVINGTAYLIGGTDGRRMLPAVTAIRFASAGPPPPGSPGLNTALQPWLAPARGRGHLARGSDPSALPADVLVADHQNNRLVVIDPQGRIRWAFPRKGDLEPGQTFVSPDDAFFTPDGRFIVATQEDDQVISVISIATHRIVYRYGKPGTPGSGPNRVSNPDDAMMTPGGDIVFADIRNCRIVIIRPPSHRPLRIIGQSANGCAHSPPQDFGSPNGAFPMTNGAYVVTEINGDWANGMTLSGHVLWSTNPPGVAYPSDTNQMYPGRLITTDYSYLGQVVEFTTTGRLLWRFGGLNHPSLALPLANGNILVNDDFNHRVIVIDPRTNKIVWQYGHTGVAGIGPGYLNDPDGVDLVPPDSLLITNAPTMGGP